MKGFMRALCIACFLLSSQMEGGARYWLIQEDFIKFGKKELYEEERKKSLEEDKRFFAKKRKEFQVIGAQDLENPQYVFLMPLTDLSSLNLYKPIQDETSPLLNTCLHFQIFSLHELLERCCFKSDLLFSMERPYLSYVLYDVEPGSQTSFENHLNQISLKQPKKSLLSWNVWKVVLGADTPKYLICTSFDSKEGLKEAEMEKIFEEAQVKDIVRNKKSGWMKTQSSFSLFKK